MNICYPGSFDPISNGHLDIIKRLAKNFDEVIILISNNVNKKYSFTKEERKHMIELATKELNNMFSFFFSKTIFFINIIRY